LHLNGSEIGLHVIFFKERINYLLTVSEGYVHHGGKGMVSRAAHIMAAMKQREREREIFFW
jgi:hypothetical protein